MRENIERDLKQTFRPEFLNRIDEIIIFHSLTQEHVKAIVDLQMGEISGRLAEHGLKIELTEPARDWLAQEGYDPQFGARPVRRTLERYVENPLARRLLAGEFKDGDTVIVGRRWTRRGNATHLPEPTARADRRRAAHDAPVQRARTERLTGTGTSGDCVEVADPGGFLCPILAHPVDVRYTFPHDRLRSVYHRRFRSPPFRHVAHDADAGRRRYAGPCGSRPRRG